MQYIIILLRTNVMSLGTYAQDMTTDITELHVGCMGLKGRAMAPSMLFPQPQQKKLCGKAWIEGQCVVHGSYLQEMSLLIMCTDLCVVQALKKLKMKAPTQSISLSLQYSW